MSGYHQAHTDRSFPEERRRGDLLEQIGPFNSHELRASLLSSLTALGRPVTLEND